MGHLSNPVGFRLAYYKKWKDYWFIKKLYYPEFINNILNMRDYFYYYLSSLEMLDSGFCLSHFYIIKYNKKFLLKIYVYQIDLERMSYDYINFILKAYYGVLSKATYINFREKKNPNYFFKYKKKIFISKLYNNNLFLFYYLFFIYFQMSNKTLSFNIKIFKNLKFSKYSNNIIKLFKNLLMKQFKFKFLLNYNNRISKNYIDDLKKKKKKIYFIYSILERYENGEKLLLDELNLLDKFKKEKLEEKRLNFFYFFLQKNFVLKSFFKKTFVDKNVVFKKKNQKITFIDFFFYLCKKMKVERYKMSYLLDIKLSRVYYYLRYMEFSKKIKKTFTNIKLFYYLFNHFIYGCNMFSKFIKSKKQYINLKNLLYFILYANLGYNGFFRLFYNISVFFKFSFNIIFSNKINYDQLEFFYYFISNKNVTSYLISRYIAVKLQKNFSLLKTLNPLRKELKFLYKRTIKKQKPFWFWHYKFLLINKKIKYLKRIRINVKLFYKIFLFYFYKFYYKNKTFLFFDIIVLCKKINKKINLQFIKKFVYIQIFYKCLLESYYLQSKKFNKVILNILFFKVFLLLQFNFFYFIKKVINTKIIFISSFFFNKYINFKYLKFIWYSFKKYNFRKVRDLYRPRYKGIMSGYKMAFRGRFSRKQRASFIWVHSGKVPLNTIRKKVDYTFFTIPLKNSLVSIKLWFYFNKIYKSYKYLIKL